ncbi:unnamed protein product [Lepeophtheirus salmonis]|uniref:(salmon louse) hypothetical protein n=1 Tax=Lepeophtheirus salmonis TaxID=72036 RepID=A0A817FCC8_LEPSM|nr:unnamed protein product [Lepeophtheirus salmonis]CAG9476470.1 unnamed protein product [Lepeophtheirus salmonis]
MIILSERADDFFKLNDLSQNTSISKHSEKEPAANQNESDNSCPEVTKPHPLAELVPYTNPLAISSQKTPEDSNIPKSAFDVIMVKSNSPVISSYKNKVIKKAKRDLS